MFWDGGGGHWVFWQAAVMWGAMVVFWGLVIWAVYALVTNAGRAPQAPWHGLGPDARSILDQRLAKGEIGPEEYTRLRETLEAGRPKAPVG